MNIPLLRRRKLFGYLGLGVGAAAVGVGLKNAVISNSSDRQTVKQASADPLLASPTQSVAISPNQQFLPEFQGINQWLNSPPLNTANLKGKVVLVQFWALHNGGRN